MRFCDVPNCNAEVHAHGVCHRHYMRVRRHGTTDAGRPADWGGKSSHPMWESWKSLIRAARRRGGYDPRWDDFWKFLEDVGERPGEKHRLYRKRGEVFYSKATVEWRAPIWSESQLADKNTYQRAWRMKRPLLARAANLKRHYGVSLEEYARLNSLQGGLCAICRKPESQCDKRTGDAYALAVDHDHETDAIRGLLCIGCNTGLGCFGDDISRLRAAIAYLESNAAN